MGTDTNPSSKCPAFRDDDPYYREEKKYHGLDYHKDRGNQEAIYNTKYFDQDTKNLSRENHEWYSRKGDHKEMKKLPDD
jgi:hypothetical protein